MALGSDKASSLCKTKQSKAKQSKAKQSKAKQTGEQVTKPSDFVVLTSSLPLLFTFRLGLLLKITDSRALAALA
jgi:hypothetical protein